MIRVLSILPFYYLDDWLHFYRRLSAQTPPLAGPFPVPKVGGVTAGTTNRNRSPESATSAVQKLAKSRTFESVEEEEEVSTNKMKEWSSRDWRKGGRSELASEEGGDERKGCLEEVESSSKDDVIEDSSEEEGD